MKDQNGAEITYTTTPLETPLQKSVIQQLQEDVMAIRTKLSA